MITPERLAPTTSNPEPSGPCVLCGWPTYIGLQHQCQSSFYSPGRIIYPGTPIVDSRLIKVTVNGHD